MMKLSQITGKTYNDIPGPQDGDVSVDVFHSEGTSEDDEDDADEEIGQDSDDDEDGGESESTPDVRPIKPFAAELVELAMKWGGTIGSTGKIINNKIEMSRKDFLKYSKDMTQEQALNDPLLHVMFRSEEQSQASFWDFLDRFPKEEYESDEQE